MPLGAIDACGVHLIRTGPTLLTALPSPMPHGWLREAEAPAAQFQVLDDGLGNRAPLVLGKSPPELPNGSTR
jgi:hypothetical protein